jgi:FMN reductase (NADPH)
MHNPTLDLIHRHGSVRNYKPDPLPAGMIETIVVAGQRASTSSNLQMYSVVVTHDLDERGRMQSYCGGQVHISQAPVFLTWCADLSRLERVCQAQGLEHQMSMMENFLLAVVDVAIAAQNAGLAAESLGLGFCYIGAIRNSPREVIDLLGLPRLVFPLVGMTLGWPAKQPKIRPRLPLDAVLHWGRYDAAQEPDHLKRYDQEMIDTGIYANRQVGTQESLDPAAYGWQVHSARRVSQVLRPHLRQVLLEQGFEMN